MVEHPAHLRWSAPDVIPAPARPALVGPGAPFELVTEDVLGTPLTVFARRPRTLRRLLDTTVARTPDLTFLVSPEREWSYREASADIDAMAVLLAERYGVRPGDRVAIVAANSAGYGLLMWATLSLGAVVTSLNGWWTGSELAHGIALTGPVLLAGDARRLARLEGSPVRVTLIDDLLREAREFRGRPAPTPETTEDSPAVILFTSGTTGRPKGATLSHRNIINFGLVSMLGAAVNAAPNSAAAPPANRPTTILTSPMFHISGLVAILLTGVAFGARLVFAPPGAWRPEVYLELTERHAVTMWSGVPTQYWRLLRHPDLLTRDLSTVVTVGAGGAVFPPELVRELHERFPSVRLGNGYGMSETVGLGTLTGGDLFVDRPDAVGTAQPTVDVQIRGADGTLLTDGEVGEIHLRTPSVFLGYWNDPDATAAVLDADRWYRTGDFGRTDGDLLVLESRRRDLILRGGENIYPIEIENRLVGHPGIDDAAVIGVDHPELGQEVKAFVVRSDGSDLDADRVRAWCAAALARYKVPAEVEFRTELPYTLTGKVMKHQLEQEERARRAALAVENEVMAIVDRSNAP